MTAEVYRIIEDQADRVMGWAMLEHGVPYHIGIKVSYDNILKDFDVERIPCDDCVNSYPEDPILDYVRFEMMWLGRSLAEDTVFFKTYLFKNKHEWKEFLVSMERRRLVYPGVARGDPGQSVNTVASDGHEARELEEGKEGSQNDLRLSLLSRAELALQSAETADLALAANLLQEIDRDRRALRSHLDRCRYTIAQARVFVRQGKSEHAAAHARLVIHYEAYQGCLPPHWTAELMESWRWQICKLQFVEMRRIDRLAPHFLFFWNGSQLAFGRIEDLHDDLLLNREFAEKFGKPLPLGNLICSALLRHQREFLENGPEFLQSLTIKEVSEEIGVSPSTIGRFVIKKTVKTPHGQFTMRSLFPQAVQTTSGCALPLSRVRTMIQRTVAGENPRDPATDEKLSSLLRDQGIVMSRRTVAKHREFLGIPNTHVRRSLN
jgi:hypothetical protein